MASKVAARPNHYQLLGLDPTASAEKIAEAFTRELRQPRTLGGVGLLSVAYQTLRDPAKRRAYDTEIGVGRPAAAQPLVGHWQTARPVATPAPRKPVPSRPQPSAPAQAAQSDLPSFLAASLRDIARPEPLGATAPTQPKAPPQAEPKRAVPPSPTRPVVAVTPPAEPQFEEAEKSAIAWKRPAAAVAALVAVAGLTGVWAGWESSNDVPSAPAEAVARSYLPPARPFPERVAEAAPLAPAAPGAQAEPAAPPPIAASAPRQPIPVPPAAKSVAQAEPEPAPASAAATEADPLAPTTAAEAVPEAAPSTRAAALPLADRTIARTIERIGYACGQVASTTAVEGSGSGVFKVTCTSGQSYQARPVGGRYHFRRWGRS